MLVHLLKTNIFDIIHNFITSLSIFQRGTIKGIKVQQTLVQDLITIIQDLLKQIGNQESKFNIYF